MKSPLYIRRGKGGTSQRAIAETQAKDHSVQNQDYGHGGGEEQLDSDCIWRVKPIRLANELGFRCEMKSAVTAWLQLFRD